MEQPKKDKKIIRPDTPLAPTPTPLQNEIIRSEILRDSESKLKSMQERRAKEKEANKQDDNKQDAMKKAGEGLIKNSNNYI